MQREQLEQQLLAERDWLTSRRWYGDKARPVADIRVVVADSVDASNHRVVLSLVEVIHEWGEPSLYFVPVIDSDASLAERDVTAHPDILQWVVDGFSGGRELAGEGVWRWRNLGKEPPKLSELKPDEIRLISGEQSNSSVILGNEGILKLFRRVQQGVNPDLEIGAHLMHIEAFDNAPDLYGVIEVGIGGQRIDIAALQQFVPNHGDGWTWLLSQLRDPQGRRELTSDVRLLGTRTGELHLALANDNGDPAFAPQLIDEDEAQRIIRRVIVEMEGSVEGLTHHLQPDEIERLHKGLGLMMGDAWSLVGTMQIRVHGDYHLGQTLRTRDNDFVIIDFEGEPSRTMAERRQKLPALKDVAGMVRSLDYAGATLIQQSEDDHERAAIAAWVKDASEAFVNAYRSVVMNAPVPLVPSQDEAFTSVLNLMIAEKALYELRYEMNNRPDWLWIPLGALLRLVGMEDVE